MVGSVVYLLVGGCCCFCDLLLIVFGVLLFARYGLWLCYVGGLRLLVIVGVACF